MSTPLPNSVPPVASSSAVVDEPLARNPDDAATPEERVVAWAGVLSNLLDRRRPQIDRFREYFDGEQPLRFASEAWEETFGETYGSLRNNWLPKTVNAATSKMEQLGWRASGEQGRTVAHERANAIWVDNELGIGAEQLHEDLSVTGYGYTLAWTDSNGRPRVTVEDPAETIVYRDPSDRRLVLAGMKRWRDVGGAWHAFVFTPDLSARLAGGDGPSASDGWTVSEIEENPYDEVPIEEFVNDPDVKGRGRSDLRALAPQQDALDKIGMDKLVASEFTSYQQRVFMDVELPTDEDGQPISRAELGITRILTVESGETDGVSAAPKPQILELNASDLSNYTKVEAAIKSDMAALSDTPPQQLLGSMDNVGGEALQAANDGLISRVRRKIRHVHGPWMRTMRRALKVDGEDPDSLLSIVWRNPEVTTLSASADMASKFAAGKVPTKATWELMGESPETVDRWWEMRREEAEEDARLEALRLGISPDGSGVPTEPLGGEVVGTA